MTSTCAAAFGSLRRLIQRNNTHHGEPNEGTTAMFYHNETTADANEAWSEARREADMEMAEWAAQAREMKAREAKGECFHNSGIGYRPTAFYPEAAHLKPGEMLCTDRCKQTVPDPFLPLI